MSRSIHQLRLSKHNESDGNSWLERSRYWLGHGDDDIRPFSRSRRIREPLIILGHGARLWVNNGCLLVRSGFTHFPQKGEQQRFFPNDPKRPERIIVVDGSGVISFDSLDWLARNDVPFVRLNWRGEVQAVIGKSDLSADPRRAELQRKAKANGHSIEIARSIISEKLKNSASTLKSVLPRSKSKSEALVKLNGYSERLETEKLKSISQIMGIEGAAAITYFGAWQSLPIKWEGTKRKPIPSDWYQIGLRSSVTRQKNKNRNASHPVNAMLNYAYGVLESQTRIQIVASGYDPSIGFLHTRHRDGSALVFDLMEPFRPIVDRAILAFISSTAFSPNDFIIRTDGVARLNPNLASAVVSMTIKTQSVNTTSCVRLLRNL